VAAMTWPLRLVRVSPEKLLASACAPTLDAEG
jgi:hypothetical protein